MRPYPKSEQTQGYQPGPKKKQPIKKVSAVKKYECSDGTMVSQVEINRFLTIAYRTDVPAPLCECCKNAIPDDHDHTIDQKRCKDLHKTELIWYFENWSFSCRTCHLEWQNFASGEFEDHKNVVERMIYVWEHDPETYRKRRSYISNYQILKQLPQ